MSGHFVYEIDERKLRVKLKELEVEIKNDSWSNFENHYSSTVQPKRTVAMQNINLPFSMNIILPLIFGGIIIIISVFLYKFIVIQNPTIENKPAPSTQIISPTKNEDSIKLSNQSKELKRVDSLKMVNAANTATVSLSTKVDSVINNTKSIVSETNTIKEKSAIKNDTISKKNVLGASSTNTQTVTKDNIKPKRKRQKKSTSEGPEDKIPDEIPSTSDENEASLKPN